MRWIVVLLLAVCVVCGSGVGICEEPEIVSGEEMFSWIEEVYEFGYRRVGTEADRRVAYYLAQKFIECGLEDVTIDPIPITVWTADKWSLAVSTRNARHAVPCFFIPYTGFTDEHGAEAEMVYVGPLRKEEDYKKFDVKGKLVVADIVFGCEDYDHMKKNGFLFYDPRETIPPGHKPVAAWMRPNWKAAYWGAHRNGAAGFVGILRDMPCNWNTLYAPYDGTMKPMPGLYVGRDDGAVLREMLQTGKVEGKLVLTGTKRPGLTENVVGFLPGKKDDIIALASEHDAPFQGAVEENGWAVVCALAEYFARVPVESREKTLMFISCAGHFYRSIGRNTFIERHIDDLCPRIVTWMHIEHIAKEYVERDGKAVYTGLPEVRAGCMSNVPKLISLTADAFKNNNVERLVLRQGGSNNQNERVGMPHIDFISGPIYLLVEHDTLDKVAVDQLRPVTSAFADLVKAIDATPSYMIRSDMGQ